MKMRTDESRLATIGNRPRLLPKPRGLRSIAAMKDEMILVVRRALFDELGAFQGLNFEIDRYLPALLARENNFFTPRPPAETDPDRKSVV